MDDVTLTFDPGAFMNGLTSINQGIQKLNSNFVGMQKSAEKGQGKVKLSAGNLLGVFGKLGLLVGGIKGVLNAIPEIGRTFSIAGGIAMRNFMYPLRKLLVPMLQKLLDWTRDHRAMFVQWGNVVANVFRAIINIAKMLYDMFKNLWERLSSGIERVFGKAINSMTDLANLAVFKITAVIQYLIITLEPFFNFIVDLFVMVMDAWKNFFKGLTEGMGNMMPQLDDMGNSFKRLFNLVSQVTKAGGALNKVFRTLGNIISMIVGPAIRGLGTLLDGIVSALEMVILKSQKLKASKSGDTREVERIKKEEERLKKEFKDRLSNRWGDQDEAWSGAISNVNNTWNDNKVSTSKKPVNNSTTNNSNITVNVTGSSDPKETGQEVKKTMEEVLREQKFRGGTK